MGRDMHCIHTDVEDCLTLTLTLTLTPTLTLTLTISRLIGLSHPTTQAGTTTLPSSRIQGDALIRAAATFVVEVVHHQWRSLSSAMTSRHPFHADTPGQRAPPLHPSAVTGSNTAPKTALAPQQGASAGAPGPEW